MWDFSRIVQSSIVCRRSFLVAYRSDGNERRDVSDACDANVVDRCGSLRCTFGLCCLGRPICNPLP